MASLEDLELRIKALEENLMRLVSGSADLAKQQGAIAANLGRLGEGPSAQLEYLQAVVFALGRALCEAGAIPNGALTAIVKEVETDILDPESVELSGFTGKTFNLWRKLS